MSLKKGNFYHPFRDSDLGFFLHDMNSDENYNPNILKDIDLYYQPVEEPEDGIIFFVVSLVALIVAEIIQFKLINMVRREHGLVKEVTQIYSMSCIIMGPFLLIFTTLTDFIHPLNEVIGEWFCFLARTLIWIHFNVVATQTLIVAMMRYWFIINEQRVKKYGKEKTKRIFIFLSIFVPIFMVTWGTIENTEVDRLLSINRCYGIDHKVFMINVISPKDLGPYYCEFGNPDDDGMYGQILMIFKHTTCILKDLLTVLMGSNVIEGILYFKIISHITRFVISLSTY